MKYSKKYPDNHALYLGLKANQDEAYNLLLAQIELPIRKLCQPDLRDEFADIRNQAVFALARNILEGKYEYREQAAVSTYVISVADNIIKDLRKKRKNNFVDPSKGSIEIEKLENELHSKESWEELDKNVEYWLSFLCEDCRTLIRLHFFEEYKYKEIIAFNKMPKFTDDGTLRNKFPKCWRDLVDIVKGKLGDK